MRYEHFLFASAYPYTTSLNKLYQRIRIPYSYSSMGMQRGWR